MEKVLFKSIVGTMVFLFFSVIYGGEFTKNLHAPENEITITVQNGKAEFDKESSTGEPGEPNIPSYNLKFLLPDGADIENVTVSLTDEQEETFTALTIDPIKRRSEYEGYRPGALIVDGKDMTIYGSDQFYPESFIQSVSTGKMRKIKIVDVRIAPYIYNPVTGVIRHLKSATLKVQFNSDSQLITPPSFNRSFLKTNFLSLLNTAVNIDDINIIIPYTTTETPVENLIILTTSDIVKKSVELERFIKSKEDLITVENGKIKVTLVTESSIKINGAGINSENGYPYGWGGGTGQAASENIRNWLKDNVDHIDYVLLIGDPNYDTGDVPMKKTSFYHDYTDWWAATALSKITPTDFYYFELDSEWKADDDGLIKNAKNGKKEWDRYPEISVGRIPVYYSNPDWVNRLDYLLRKAMIYENNILGSERDQKNVLMLRDNMNWGHNIKDPEKTVSKMDTNKIAQYLEDNGSVNFRDSAANPDSPWYYRVFSVDTKVFAYSTEAKAIAECVNKNFEVDGTMYTFTCDPVQKHEDRDNTGAVIHTDWRCTCEYPDFFDDETRYDNVVFGDGLDHDVSRNNTATLWNVHQPGIVLWWAHGLERSASAIMAANDAFDINRTEQAVVFQTSCLNGWPDDFDMGANLNPINNGDYFNNRNDLSLAHAMILNGAVTTIAANRVSWSDAFDKVYNFTEGVYSEQSVGSSFVSFLKDSDLGWRNRILYTLYGDPSIRLIRKGYDDGDDTDTDGDGIRDKFDNCPYMANHSQNDFQDDRNNDGIGDICEDADGDGIQDVFDLCPNIPSNKDCSSCEKNPSPTCCDQPDWNKDGVGDECDRDSDGIDDFIDDYVFYTDGFWWKESKLISDPGNKHIAGTNYEIWITATRVGEEIELSARTGMKDETATAANVDAPETYVSQYYCYCGTTDNQHDKCNDDNSLCGPNHARPNASGVEDFNPRKGVDQQGKRIWNPAAVKRAAFSSETPDFLNIKVSATIKDPKTATRTKEIKHSRSWDYQTQIGITPPTEDEPTSYDDLISTGAYPMTKISYAPVNVISDLGTVIPNGNIIPGYMDNQSFVNFNYFKNYEQSRTTDNKRTLAFGIGDEYNIDLIVEKSLSVKARFYMKYLPRAYWQMMSKYLPKPWETGPGNPWEYIKTRMPGDNPSMVTIRDALMKPESALSASFYQGRLTMKDMHLPSGYQQIFSFRGMDAVYSKRDGAYQIETLQKGGNFKTFTTVSNGIDLNGAAVIEYQGSLYIAGNMQRMMSYMEVYSSDILSDIDGDVVYEPVFVKMDLTGDTATFISLTNLPSPARFLNIFELDNKLFYITENIQGQTAIYQYNGENTPEVWTLKVSDTFSDAFSLQNIKVINNVAYFTAGDSVSGTTKIYTYSGANEIHEYASLPLIYDAALKLYNSDDILTAVHVNKLDSSDLSGWTISESDITPITVSVSMDPVPSTEDAAYCFQKSNNVLRAGIEQAGVCVPFTNKQIDSWDHATTIKTLDGRGNTLYIGGTEGIDIMSIDDTSITPQDFVDINDPVYDIEVAGDTLYAGTIGGVYIFNIDADGSLHFVQTIETSTTVYVVKVENNVLYVGDSVGVISYDITDDYATIAFADFPINVYDLVVVKNGLLYVYDDYGTIVFDGQTLAYTADTYSHCDSPVLAAYKDDVYLGCGSDTIYKVEVDSTVVNYIAYTGDDAELHDTHVFGSYGFIHDGDTIRVSSIKTEDASTPICGNNIIEVGEICDGNTISCVALDSYYSDGTAECAADCQSYTDNNCVSGDGWQ